eukprot:CAMPEP_0179156810 /NCGR_PEP_ID=MMETSP0796-20121207/76457_1 /TAXON_ID=73915 /ORGANISM="Pyrodinium bahamense, Strain pbaha01" /LENGTH=70 /DNA_ID=CAMNT_0020858403 /DNA_START=174 /DNA_END=383 /DNA_ORIENTATION=-
MPGSLLFQRPRPHVGMVMDSPLEARPLAPSDCLGAEPLPESCAHAVPGVAGEGRGSAAASAALPEPRQSL